MLAGYRLQVLDWVPLRPGRASDLAITFLSCDECEPTELCTALYFEPKNGWLARWPNKNQKDLSGIVLSVGDAGIPYSNEIVDQVWAAVWPAFGGPISIGTWYHARDTRTGRITSVAMRFFVDPVTNEDSGRVCLVPKL
jgi:hypothetical protein